VSPVGPSPTPIPTRGASRLRVHRIDRVTSTGPICSSSLTGCSTGP
jgi:hypothetical protein